MELSCGAPPCTLYTESAFRKLALLGLVHMEVQSLVRYGNVVITLTVEDPRFPQPDQ